MPLCHKSKQKVIPTLDTGKPRSFLGPWAPGPPLFCPFMMFGKTPSPHHSSTTAWLELVVGCLGGLPMAGWRLEGIQSPFLPCRVLSNLPCVQSGLSTLSCSQTCPVRLPWGRGAGLPFQKTQQVRDAHKELTDIELFSWDGWDWAAGMVPGLRFWVPLTWTQDEFGTLGLATLEFELVSRILSHPSYFHQGAASGFQHPKWQSPLPLCASA